MKISSKYEWLGKIEDAPKMIKEAVKLGKLDTTEWAGIKSNPEILQLAKEAGVESIYKNDDMPWCAVAHTVVCLRAGKEVPFTGWDRLRAVSFLEFGEKVNDPEFGDTLVFKRKGGYHVGLYVGEDDLCYHVAGGNQSNQYNVTRINKIRLLEARRPKYTNKPESVKKIYLKTEGTVSLNEA